VTDATELERALLAATVDLRQAGRLFALVGGLAVSVRAEVRFTRDVDFAVVVSDDSEAESLVFELKDKGYRPVALVEHDTQHRRATARVLSERGIKVDLLFASSGIEREIVERSHLVHLSAVGDLPVARAEELLAMKVLSMTDRRLQDRLDARHLLQYNPALNLAVTRSNLELIAARGFARGQDLQQKLEALVRGG
jgi:nucleotidyltransferase AbiEii toxin of type IV toxin-antitoxin system